MAPICLLALLMGGCASTPSVPPVSDVDVATAPHADDAPSAHRRALRSEDPAVSGLSTVAKQASLMLAVLHDQAREWRGVPYQWGGLSEEGVDCSGLVYLTFMSRLGVE